MYFLERKCHSVVITVSCTYMFVYYLLKVPLKYFVHTALMLSCNFSLVHNDLLLFLLTCVFPTPNPHLSVCRLPARSLIRHIRQILSIKIMGNIVGKLSVLLFSFYSTGCFTNNGSYFSCRFFG